ncbi:helix-turn-helix domain-containing protein [Rhizobium glycinendophyticum]|uniref:AraC family transcriptional regulator n=1 Tax=Rhizobium glycinendophyticum TaxID=2589807 RepID=A0A504TRX1_9HYPH|nr:AraC family transcriptional regulator [Rhizobium glycinendophyticum]TPP05498.1 AraC family transcriptional regulator [Rhizobium glycinendophyticum]
MSDLRKHKIWSEDHLEMQTFSEAVFRPSLFESLEKPGPFDITANIAAIQEMTIWQIRSMSGYRVRYGCPHQHQVEIHFIETGQFVFRAAGEEIVATAGSAVLLKDTRKIETVASPNSAKLAMVVPFNQVAHNLNRSHGSAGRGLGEFRSLVGPDVTGIDIIQRIATHLLYGIDPADDPADAEGAPALVHDALIMMFASLWPRTTAGERTTLPRPLERAINWLDQHAHEDISIEQLARRAGASIRTLQNSFRQHLSTTPNAYLLQLRLSRVHEDLLHGPADQTIEAIASRWGFKHMGYFAARYRELYGTSPSDTRKARPSNE